MLWAPWAQLGSCSASHGVGWGCRYLGVQMVRWAGMLRILVGHRCWLWEGSSDRMSTEAPQFSSRSRSPCGLGFSPHGDCVQKRERYRSAKAEVASAPRPASKIPDDHSQCLLLIRAVTGPAFLCTWLNMTNISLSPIIHGNFLNSVFITNCTNWL